MRARQHLPVTVIAALVVAVIGLSGWALRRFGESAVPGTSSEASPVVSGAADVDGPRQTFYRVELDGRFAGWVADPAALTQIVDEIIQALPPEASAYAELRALVRTSPVPFTHPPELTDPDSLREPIQALAPRLEPAWAITVDGRDVVAVTTEADARRVVDEIQEDYKETVLAEAASVEQLSIVENIGFRPKLTLFSNIRTVEQAKEILRFGTGKRIFYTVQRGDTLWELANDSGVTVDDLLVANPEVVPEALQPGQQISLTVREPYVHLESAEIQVIHEGIPFPEEVIEDPELWPWQVRVLEPGRWGQRELTVRIIRRDGREEEREVLSSRVLTEPSKQVTVRGSRQAPKMGTGKFHWPVNGQLTDRYGPRWGGWHPGIDIATDWGTPVVAADSGTVTFVGWLGNYGQAIQIDHGEAQVVTLYAHLSAFEVELGQTVEAGQVIGRVGSTGYSTGPHLHFEVRIDGRANDPLKFYP